MNILDGIRVIDWTAFQAGPVAGMMLADLGAEVIKVEEWGRGDPERGLKTLFGVELGLPGNRHALVEYYNRGKKSISVNLKKRKGREIIYRLAEKSDVFITNFRRDAAVRTGVDFDTLRRYNPQLIYGCITGFGPKGPAATAPSYDLTAQARSGIMLGCGEPDMPPIMLSPGFGDQLASLTLSFGVLAALLGRQRHGIGQEVIVSQMGSLIIMQGCALSVELLKGNSFARQSRAKAKNPGYNFYKCKDDKWLCLALIQSDRYWVSFCKAIGSPDLGHDPKFDNADKRSEKSEELIHILDRVFATKTSKDWTHILHKYDINCAPVNDLSELAFDPQVLENENVVEFGHPVLGRIKFPGQLVHFSETPGTIRSAAPEYGEHNLEVLSEICGYSLEEIAELAGEEVI